MKDILDLCIKVQLAWIYLQPIFYSEDLKRQMQVFRFKSIVWLNLSVNQI